MMSHEPDSLRAPTVDAAGRRRWLYPDRRPGRLSRIRGRLAALLFLLYIAVPFIKVEGLPLLRLDVLHSTAYGLGLAFPFSQAYYLVFILLIGALSLGFVTSLWGRVWCGYACPQTVFVEWVIRPIEEWIEGPALQRKRRDQGAKDLGFWWRKIVKHGLFIAVIWLISNAFIAYFVDPMELFSWARQSPTEHAYAFALVSLIFAAIYFDLVWFREQFCAFLCPYARFQSVMISRATPTVAYDQKRGEPRGKQGQGDCIDCQLCVRVCPTGIDIRNGLQLECIQCGRCADACHTIMSNLKRPTGLIRTASELELKGTAKAKTWRLRPLLYLGLIVINLAFVAQSVGTRKDLQITLLRQARTTYSMMDETSFGNYFTVRVLNQTREPRSFKLTAEPGIRLICSLCGQTIAPHEDQAGLVVVVVPLHFTRDKVRLYAGNEDWEIPLIKKTEARRPPP